MALTALDVVRIIYYILALTSEIVMQRNLNTSIQGVKAAAVNLTRAHNVNMPNMRLLVSDSVHFAHRGGWLQSWRTNPPFWGLRFLQVDSSGPDFVYQDGHDRLTGMATIKLRILLPNLAVLVISEHDLKRLDIPQQVSFFLSLLYC